MACTLTKGLAVDCKDQIGGLKAIFFASTYSPEVRSAATFNGTDVLQMDTAGFTGWSAYGTPTASTVTVFKLSLIHI